MPHRIFLVSVLLLTSITHSRPLVSLRDDAQQPQVVPFTGVDPTDPRMAHGPDGLRPVAAAIAMILGNEQSKGRESPGTILLPYERPHTTPAAPTHFFVSPTNTVTDHPTPPPMPTPSLRASESTPDINPAPQSNRSQRSVVILAAIASTVLGLLVIFTVGKYTLDYLRKAKRKFRLSQESWGHKEKVFAPTTHEVPSTDAHAERHNLKAFSFPGRPGRKVVRQYDPTDAPPSKPSIRTRFSNLIASTAFRQSHRDRDSITTQDTASTTPYLLKVPPNTQADHSRTRSTPVITHDDSMSTMKPAKSTESEWDIARSYRASQGSVNLPPSLMPSTASRLSRVETRW